jgi:hypothetical protein
MRRGIVPEFLDQNMSVEGGLHDPSLHPAPSPVHEPYLAKAGGCRSRQVFLYNRRNVSRRKGMEIEFSLNRNTMHVEPLCCRANDLRPGVVCRDDGLDAAAD